MGKGEKELLEVKAYSVLPSQEDEVQQREMTAGAVNDGVTVEILDEPAAHSVSSEYTHILETNGLSWRDDFFDNGYDDDIVAAFDFDYDAMESHYKCLSWGCLGVSSVCCPGLIPWLLLGLVPCNVNNNVRWNVRAQHIALTSQGVLFIHNRHQWCWGEPFCSTSKNTKFIPYEQISECTVENGNNTTCVVTKRVLSKVTVKSYSDFEIGGLTHPHEFQRLVMSLKHRSSPSAMVMDNRDIGTAAQEVVKKGGEDAKEVVKLLREIRDELRKPDRSENPPIAAMALVEPSALPAQQEE